MKLGIAILFLLICFIYYVPCIAGRCLIIKELIANAAEALCHRCDSNVGDGPTQSHYSLSKVPSSCAHWI